MFNVVYLENYLIMNHVFQLSLTFKANGGVFVCLFVFIFSIIEVIINNCGFYKTKIKIIIFQIKERNTPPLNSEAILWMNRGI